MVLDLFKRDEHDDVPGSESHEVGGETLVEGEGAFLGDHAADEAWHTLCTAGLSVHDARLQHVHGGADDAGNETGTESTKEVHWETF